MAEKEKGLDNEGYEVNENENAPGPEEKKSRVVERLTWSNSLDLLMSCIALSVGLGNIWRFPFTAYENGGGAFIIPYIIILFLVGKPMYYMEMILGQFSGRNGVRVWAITPFLRGTGVAQMVANGSIVSYYVSLIALALFYLVNSFSAELPWAECWSTWEEPCFSAANTSKQPNEAKSSSELYFLKEVLKQKLDISEGIGLPDWRLTLCLLGAWCVIFLVMVKGIKSTGKAAYFLALFPYVIMFTLLIRAVTLEGAVNGIIFFIEPKWDQLLNLNVWYAAVTQAFFSLSVAHGSLVMLSSYNKFDHKVYRDTMIVTTLDTFTSLLAGFTIFGILGNLAHEKGVDNVKEVIGSGGASLAFISYPDAITKFQWVPQLFAVLFFLMLFVLGLGSAVALQSTIVTTMADKFTKRKFWQMALPGCIIGFLIGLIYVTPGGQQILTLVDKYPSTFLLLGTAIPEIGGFIWVYGLENFCEDTEFMTSVKVSVYWRWCWAIITPFIMMFVFVYAFVVVTPTKYGSYVLPSTAEAAGWAAFAFGMFLIPYWAVKCYFKKRDINVKETLKKCYRPSPGWGPVDPEIRKRWREYKDERIKLRESLNLPRWKHFWYSLNGTYRQLMKEKLRNTNL